MALNWINPGPDEWAATTDFVQSDEVRELRPSITDSRGVDGSRDRFARTELVARK